MKIMLLLVFGLIISSISAQDYNYLQNGIKPSGKWLYTGKPAPEGFKRDTSANNYSGVWVTNRYGGRTPVCDSSYIFPPDSINRKNSKGKQGHWIYYGKDRPESGFPLDAKVEEGYYVDDRKEGIWVKYNADGTPRLKGYYENNRPKSNCTFSRHGIREEGTFSKNQYVDSLKRFHKNGKLEYEAFYNQNGKEEGRVNYYYPNGQLEFTYNSVNGTPTGKATRYYENGDIKELIEYAEDGSIAKKEYFERATLDPSEIISTEKAPLPVNPINTKGIKWRPDGYNKIYNDDDEVWQDGIFKEGKLWEGKVYVYDRDGILLRVKVFKNGVYHSDGQL
jgi:antitoxin component YwqK of YwqJK toxin-antitoxin module